MQPARFRQIAVVVRHGWIDGNGPANQLDRLLQPALLQRHHAQEVQSIRVIWKLVEDALISARRSCKTTGLMIPKRAGQLPGNRFWRAGKLHQHKKTSGRSAIARSQSRWR